MKRRIIKIISLILCGAVLICSNATAQCTQNIDKLEKSSYTEYVYESGSSLSLNEIRSQSEAVSAVIISPFLIVFVRETLGFLGKIKTVFFVGSEVKIKSSTENFCKVESKNGTVGYVFKWWLDEQDDKEDDGTLKFNREFDHVYIDGTNINESTGKPRTQLQPNYSGTVTYSSSNSDIISVDSKTGLITGKKAGTANLKATVDGETVSIPVYCIYKWKKGWTGKASKSTTVYSGSSNSTTALTTISSGIKFYVTGDDGSSAGWAYGYVNISNGTKWGFVKINDISTKGTVSQYNNMGWSYPIKRDLFKHISSPYGWRGDYRHLGFDINRQGNTPIEGEFAVALFNGTVVFANTSYNSSTKKPDYGYCVVIEASNDKDPVSGKKLRAVYMHFLEKPMVDVGDPVIAGKTELGKVGSTGNSTGPHLHLEINNKETSFAGSTNSDSFDKTINPIFFYLYSGIKDDSDSTYNEYWYNDNK